MSMEGMEAMECGKNSFALTDKSIVMMKDPVASMLFLMMMSAHSIVDAFFCVEFSIHCAL